MRIQPALTPKEAKRFAKVFIQTGARCGVDWRTLASIAFNESSMGLNRVNSVTDDHGLMQINIKNIEKLHLSPKRVQVDDELSVKIACGIIQAAKARYSQTYPHWLGTYRSGTRLSSPKIRKNAEAYDHMIRDTSRRIASYELDPRT